MLTPKFAGIGSLEVKMDEQIKKYITELVEGSRDAIVCSIDDHGFPNAKAMFARVKEGVHTFWFSTNVSAARTGQWLKRPNACIYFDDPKQIHGLMLTGTMKVHTDNETKQAYWQEGDEMYYSLGPTDPDYCMLEFTAEKGNYWGFPKFEFLVSEF